MSTIAKFSTTEKALKSLSGFFTGPFGFGITPPNYKKLIVRFGKPDRIINSGFYWTPLFYDEYTIFTGKQTIHLKNMKLTDIQNLPIDTDVIICYEINDVEKWVINSNQNNNMLNDIICGSVRNVLKKYRYQDSDVCIKNNSIELCNELVNTSNENLFEFGVNITSGTISEANYSKEIMQIMLIRQQTQAILDSRKLIVENAVLMTKDITSQLPNLSKDAHEKFTVNLITILSSQDSVKPTLNMM